MEARTQIADFLGALILVYTLIIFASIIVSWIFSFGVRVPYSRPLNAVLDFLPSPLDVPAIEGMEPVRGDEDRPATRKADDSEPFSALAFKIMADPFVGKLTYFRVYSGKLEAGSRVLNVGTGKTERIGRILIAQGRDATDCAISTTFGKHRLAGFTVITDEVAETEPVA